MILHDRNHSRVSRVLNAGQLVVLRTDTIYGILARACDPVAVRRLYRDRPRSPHKSSILLVAHIDDIPRLTDEHKAMYLQLSSIRPTTLITKVESDYLPHLMRQHETLAFRLIPPSELAELIKSTGPLIAPSANPEDQPPATTIEQAMGYFGDKVAIYVDGGKVSNTQASKIVAINDDDEIEIIRG